jgi:hypothetical protein
LLGHQFLKLSILEHLSEGAHREAEHGNSRAQIEGLLKRAHSAHFVVTQPDPEATAFAVALAASAASSTTAIAAAFTLSALVAGIAVGISHGPGPAVRRKCDASPPAWTCCGQPHRASATSATFAMD